MLQTQTLPSVPESGQAIWLDSIGWGTYRRIGRAFQDRPLRITYDRGRLEIMTTSSLHERIKHLLGVLIVALAEELDLDIAGFGSMTFQKRERRRGLEPDECYWIQNAAAVQGKTEFELGVDPAPDLVVEIEVSRSVINRLGILKSLRVPEIWTCDGSSIRVRTLSASGRYTMQAHSRCFPFLTPADLMPFIERGIQTGDTKLLKEFRAWVRQQQSGEQPA